MSLLLDQDSPLRTSSPGQPPALRTPTGLQFPTAFKLYSLTTIGAGTFLGGPLAGGLMARRNLLNLGRNRSALTPIYLSLAMTIAVFLVVAMAPSGLTEKLPGSFMPAIYIAILVGWCRNAMGSEIDQHKVDGGPF